MPAFNTFNCHAHATALEFRGTFMPGSLMVTASKYAITMRTTAEPGLQTSHALVA